MLREAKAGGATAAESEVSQAFGQSVTVRRLAANLIANGVQTIVFARSRASVRRSFSAINPPYRDSSTSVAVCLRKATAAHREHGVAGEDGVVGAEPEGDVVFGVGWGLAGFCPGPALVSLGAGQPKAAVFVLAMLAGMGVFEMLEAKKHPFARGV